jgi:hypothetical protein
MDVRHIETWSREQLALLVREYLMAGHLIDRAGMPYVIEALGRDGMRDVAIEEWMGASPIYTKRMQRALGFEGDTVETIFKGMQFDVGAPHQFLDFRYQLHDAHHGEFWLDHCGALADVEPMGEDFVVAMCHDIEDPTFDATAIASNPRAQVRPVHRPPRVPADRTPVCAWTVTIADDHPALDTPVEAVAIGATRAASVDLPAIDESEPGRHDYAGPLLADVRFEDWSASALLRIADELSLQGHLLALSFLASLGRRVDADTVTRIGRQQFIGAAGVAADRLRAAFGLSADLDGAARLLGLHPALRPAAYVQAETETDDRLVLRLAKDTPAVADGGWLALLTPEHLEPLDAIVRAADARLRCDPLDDDSSALTVEVVIDDVPASVAPEVAVARFSTGAEFRFEDRGTPVEVRTTGA